jgi:phage recombination protein Bet
MAKEQGLIKYESRGQEVVLTAEIVREFLVTGKKELVSNQEITYFLAQCQARQMNPFVKDCYLVKFDTNPAAIIVAIDYYRSRARSAKDCVGWEVGVICLDKKTGGLRYSKGLVLPHEELVGAWFRARPTGWHVDCELEVNLSGYVKDNAFWKGGKAATMIAKVAESQGLRRVWPDLFQGTYTAEERNFDLDQLDAGTPPPPGSAGDITPKPEPEKLDTSKFDKAVKKLKWASETMARLEKWLADTAATAGNKAGKVYTPDMIKVSCVSDTPATPPYATRWDQFLGTFKEWVAAAEAAEADAAAAEGTADPSAAPEAGQEESEKALPLADRKQAAWHQVVALGIPLTNLAVIKCPDGTGMSKLADIDGDNIGELEELIATYPKKGK